MSETAEAQPLLHDVQVYENGVNQVADFRLSNVDTNIANRMRQALMTGIPCFAFDEPKLSENTSSFHDQALLHKITLIPIDSRDLVHLDQTTLAHLISLTSTTEEGVYVRFKLEASHDPKIHGALGSFSVTSDHLVRDDCTHPSTAHDQLKNVRAISGVPIVRLRAGQSVKLIVHAQLGFGKEHQKWSPSYGVSMRPLPLIKFDKEKLNEILFTDEKKDFLVRTCRRGVFVRRPVSDASDGIVANVDSVTLPGLVDIEDASRCSFCNDCQMIPGVRSAVKISPSKTNHLGHVASTGAMDVADIIEYSIAVVSSQ